jgi:hypothetical protein
LENSKNLKEMCYTPNHHEVKGMMIDFSYLEILELIDLPSFIGFSNAMDLKELNQVSNNLCFSMVNYYYYFYYHHQQFIEMDNMFIKI